MQDQVYCVDCKHRTVSFTDWLFLAKRYRGKCKLTYVEAHDVDDPVVGKSRVSGEYQSCSLARLQARPCGPQGKLWEPKNKKHLFLYLKRVGS